MAVKDYEEAKKRAGDFVRTFAVKPTDGTKEFVYSDQIVSITRRKQVALYVNMDHVKTHDEELHAAIEGNTLRYQKIFAEAIDDYIEELRGGEEPMVMDACDAFIFQRQYMDRQAKEKQTDVQSPSDAQKAYPPELMRRYEIYFIKESTAKSIAVRDVRANHVGHLISMRGIVIRATDVKPSLSVVTYMCDTCGAEAFQPVTGRTFMPPLVCPSRTCIESRANGRLQQHIRASKMPKFQELHIQEQSDQVPVGSIPRSITVYARGENTRLARPGDHVILSGVLTPSIGTSLRQQGGGLIADVVLETHHIYNTRSEGEDVGRVELTEEEMNIVTQENIYDLLAHSIAPEVYGLLDVKKALLLAMVGGVDASETGMRIRGAINVLLVGDPGVAKSQLLSYVDRLALRSQYTTGRGSSGVGLTAAVVQDPLTGEMTLEGGALVLADGGVCCIDEFDKMMEGDRTAIHEVMEQQTISIAKAGILTSLNARVAIIAAANPAYGRYNPRRSVEKNIELPAALISRFDLLFLMRDTPNSESDLRLATHVTHVHREGRQPASTEIALPMELIRKYLTFCKTKQPKVDVRLMDRLVEKYVDMRKEAEENDNMTYTSPRILLAVIRLATALARVNLADEVTSDHLDEAIRLMDASKASLNPHVEHKRRRKPEDEAFDVIRELIMDQQPHSRAELRRCCARRGVTDAVFDSCMDQWLRNGILDADDQDRIRYVTVS